MAADYKVLVGDDDPAILRLLSRWLQKAGYPTRTATDGQEALDAIEADCPDFVITDWEMPRINGLELCRRIRELHLPHYVYVLFLTVKTAPDEMIAGLEVGADDFLAKPVSEAELLARMRSGSRVLKLERRLNVMARTDALTGLMTRRSFYESLVKEWHRSRRSGRALSCVMIDLDFFKQVNDVHGHLAGDAMLKAAAEVLASNCRASDSICRYGGEEFCVMLPETTEADATQWAERARQRLAGVRVPAGTREMRITASFGVAEYHNGSDDSEHLVNHADQALLCAKRLGRDRVVQYALLVEPAEPEFQRLEQHEGIFQGIVARDVMSPLDVCLRVHQTVDEAAQFFLQSGIPSTPILDAAGALVGFLSERNVMAAMSSPEYWQRPLSTIMRANVICYEEDTPIRVVYEFLCRVSVRRVVVTSDGRPTGTIGRSSLLAWFRNWVISRGLAPAHGPVPDSTSCPSVGCG